MLPERPAQPILATLLGGIGGLLLLAGVIVALGTFGSFPESTLVDPAIASAFLGLRFATPLLVWLGAAMLIGRPGEHVVWSWLILLFGLVGFGPWNFFGFYAIGSLLSIAG